MLKLEDIRWKLDFFKNIYQQLLEDHRAFLSQLDMSGGLKQPLIILSLVALLSAVLSTIFTSGLSLLSIPAITVSFVVVITIWSGILHLLRGFLSAQGEFSSYMRFSAWYCLLTIPLMILASVLPGVGQWINFCLMGLWFYAFLQVFQAALKRLVLVAVAVAMIWIIPLVAVKVVTSLTENSMSQLMQDMPDGPEKTRLLKGLEAIKKGDVQAIRKYQAALEKSNDEQGRDLKRLDQGVRDLRKAIAEGNECQIAWVKIKTNVLRAEIDGGASVRQKTIRQLESQLTEQLSSYQDWVKSAGGESVVRQYAIDHPEQGKQYADSLDQMNCLEKNLRELSSL